MSTVGLKGSVCNIKSSGFRTQRHSGNRKSVLKHKKYSPDTFLKLFFKIKNLKYKRRANPYEPKGFIGPPLHATSKELSYMMK